jgi:TolB-like protein/DNA-binding winged helix-turn-helix (wHTH) protein/Tfp pilus assembly protein PilF
MSLMEKEMYYFGPFSLDPSERVLSHDGTPLTLTPKVFDTLLCLIHNRGRVLTKDELLKEIWPDAFVEEVNLAVNISTLRKALGEGPKDGRYIVTVPGRGYRFVAVVHEVADEDEKEESPVAESHSESQTTFIESGPAGAGSVRNQPAPEMRADLRRFKSESENGSETNGRSGVVGSLASVVKGGALRLAIPAALTLMLAATTGGYFWLEQKKGNATAPEPASIAVLPFADLSPSKDQEYFSDGLSEELINELAKAPGLKVVARSSAFQFKGKNEDLRSVGHKLGVSNILEGSVRKEGDRIRISAELIKADDGFQLWSETYDRKINDIFAVQDEIARAATGALQMKLLGANGAAVSASARSANPEAYQAYLQGQYFLSRGDDKENLDKALAYADGAIRLDAKYAPAWALRSRVYNLMADTELVAETEGFRRAREDAKRAIALDPSLATGYTALGSIQVSYDWDWDGAETSLKKAAVLEPGSAEVLRYRALLFEPLGRLEEAVEAQKQAIAFDPLRPRTYTFLGYQLYSMGRFEEAQAALQKSLELNPQKGHDHVIRGQILLAQGRPQQALAEIEQEPREFWRLMGEALAYQALSRPLDSEAALKKLIADHQKYAAYQIADVYAYRGESGKAFEWLDRAYQHRDGGLLSLKIDPLLKSLRQDPRYSELLKKMRLPV